MSRSAFAVKLILSISVISNRRSSKSSIQYLLNNIFYGSFSQDGNKENVCDFIFPDIIGALQDFDDSPALETGSTATATVVRRYSVIY